LHLAGEDADQQASTPASRCGAYGAPAFDPTYRRRWDRTPRFLSPAVSRSGKADVTVKRSASRRRLGSERESRCALFGTCVLPSFNAVQAPRLAVPAQPPLSKPFHPQAKHREHYTTKGPLSQNLQRPEAR
jgi:hypothetical protein